MGGGEREFFFQFFFQSVARRRIDLARGTGGKGAGDRNEPRIGKERRD